MIAKPVCRRETDMLTLKEQAEVCRNGLIIGLLTKQDVILWADHMIETQDDTDYAVIETSLGPPDMAAQLFEVKGAASQRAVTEALLGLCAQALQQGRLSLREAADILGQLDHEPSCSRCSIQAEYTIAVKAELAHTAYNLACGYRSSAERNDEFLAESEAALADFLKQHIVYASALAWERASS
jgi:hypothetical protein